MLLHSSQLSTRAATPKQRIGPPNLMLSPNLARFCIRDVLYASVHHPPRVLTSPAPAPAIFSSLLFHHFARSSPPARLATMLALPLISILVLSLSLILLPAPASAGAFSHPAIRASLLQARQSSSQSPQDQATALICQANPQVANSDCTNNIGPQVQQTFSSYCSIPGTNATDEAADPPASCTDDA